MISTLSLNTATIAIWVCLFSSAQLFWLSLSALAYQIDFFKLLFLLTHSLVTLATTIFNPDSSPNSLSLSIIAHRHVASPPTMSR